MMGAASLASSAGRMNGTSPQCALATEAISASSVDTIVRSNKRDCAAASMLQAIRGFPASYRTFLRGRPLDPPRPTMIANTRLSWITACLAFPWGRYLAQSDAWAIQRQSRFPLIIQGKYDFPSAAACVNSSKEGGWSILLVSSVAVPFGVSVVCLRRHVSSFFQRNAS